MKKQYQLPKEFATKWVIALRSGDYKQSIGYLHTDNNNGYCCLGLGARLCGVPNEKLTGKQTIPISGGIYSHVPNLLKGAANGKYENQFIGKVAPMNDYGKSFPEIADWIEENVEFI